MNKAFVLGAGLGTRLRPLTDVLPKPLIPVLHKPLITYAFDHLLGAGMKEFIVNTHHLPEKYHEAFPEGNYRSAPITFSHEPVLLETGGGIANIAPLVAGGSFVVYNGDILTTLPLKPLLAEHARGENLVTLVLRSTGPALHIAWDEKSGRVTDIRGKLGTATARSFQFTGIYAVSPSFLPHLTPGKIESVIPVFLKLIAEGARIGGVVIDEGVWWDLGDRESYLQAHAALLSPDTPFRQLAPALDPAAVVSPEAELKSWNVISAGSEVGADSTLEECILWRGARVLPGARLRRCVVRSGMPAGGTRENEDI